MIPYHQMNRVDEIEKAMCGDYDGQGKTHAQEVQGSRMVIVLCLGWIGILVAMTLLTIPLWLGWILE